MAHTRMAQTHHHGIIATMLQPTDLMNCLKGEVLFEEKYMGIHNQEKCTISNIIINI